MTMNIVYFVLIIVSQIMFWRDWCVDSDSGELAYDMLAGAIGITLFFYPMVKVYIHFALKTSNLFLVFEKIFPVFFIYGVSKKVIGIGGCGFNEVVFGILLILILADWSGRIREEIMNTFWGDGWDDEFEKSLFFIRFPPVKVSDMLGFHCLVMVLFLWLLF